MERSQQPLVSVVTPVYNGEEFLSECIESVLAQSYKNWEYTIVNNCSTDATIKIARSYAARDSRIRVHNNDRFLNVIQNHNMAVRQVSPVSKYCKVVFADDWIYPECLERMVEAAERYPSAGIIGAYTLEGSNVTCSGLPYSVTVMSGRETCRRHILSALHLFGSANSLLYRSDFVRSRDSFYNESNIHADTEACFEMLQHSDFAFVHQVLTFTRVRDQSLTAASRKLQTDLGGTLQVLKTHGAKFLSETELEGCIEKQLTCYYGFLAKSLFHNREKEFWDYHVAKLNGVDLPYSRVRLLRALASLGLRSILNPADAVSKVVQALSKRESSFRGYGCSETTKSASVKESL